MAAAVYTFQLRTFHLNKTVNKKKSRKCKKHRIKNFLFLYYIQAKYGDIADRNSNAADDDERSFNYRWPKLPLQLASLDICKLACESSLQSSMVNKMSIGSSWTEQLYP